MEPMYYIGLDLHMWRLVPASEYFGQLTPKRSINAQPHAWRAQVRLTTGMCVAVLRLHCHHIQLPVKFRLHVQEQRSKSSGCFCRCHLLPRVHCQAATAE